MDLSEFIADSLFGLHTALAALSGKPIWAIEKDEATKLGTAVTNVTRHYDIPGMDQKTVDWVRLLQAFGLIYGMRIFAARTMRAAEAAKPQPKAEPTVAQQSNGTGDMKPAEPMYEEVTPVPGMPPVRVRIN